MYMPAIQAPSTFTNSCYAKPCMLRTAIIIMFLLSQMFMHHIDMRRPHVASYSTLRIATKASSHPPTRSGILSFLPPPVPHLFRPQTTQTPLCSPFPAAKPDY
jgi:hypothetical protein